MSRPLVVLAAVTALGCQPVVPSTGQRSDSGGPHIGQDGQDGQDGTDTTPPGPCGLSHDLDQAYFSEGDTVSFSLACAQPNADGTVFAVLGAGSTAEVDSDSGVFSWTTDGGDAGEVELTLSAESPGSGLVPETTRVVVWIIDNPDAPGARDPDPDTYFEEWGLPVVHIDLDGSLSESDTPATITVRGQQVEGSAKIRGASSTTYPKRSYTLDFDSDELSVDEWGDRSRGHMVLTTPFDDNSYIRQKLVFDVWTGMAEHLGADRLTPRTFFAVVYLEGEYQGLYMACDRIDDEFVRHMGFDGDGDMYKSVSHNANFRLTGTSGTPKTNLASGWEKKEGADMSDFSSLQDLVAFTGAATGATMEADGGAWLDLDEFTDWQLLVMFTHSEDSAGKNAYLYQDDDTGQFRFVPWDFNASWGQNWYTVRISPDTINDFYVRNRVFELLNSQPTAWTELQRRYWLLRDGGPFDPDWLNAKVDSYVATIGPSVARDWEHWGGQYRTFDRWESPRNSAGDWTDPDGEVAYIRAWFDARTGSMDAWVE